jgi:hypothetical protein
MGRKTNHVAEDGHGRWLPSALPRQWGLLALISATRLTSGVDEASLGTPDATGRLCHFRFTALAAATGASTTAGATGPRERKAEAIGTARHF